MLRATVFLGLVALAAGTCHKQARDCQYREAEWSPCDPCTQRSSRMLQILASSRHNGKPCPAELVETRLCETDAVCPSAAGACAAPNIDCKLAGRCLAPSLRCNGDDDCGNNADEVGCDEMDRARSMAQVRCLETMGVPYLDQLGQGIDGTTGKPVGRVLDHQRFNGLCRSAFDEKQEYRMPYNLNDLRFGVESDNGVKSNIFRGLRDLQQYVAADDGLVQVAQVGAGTALNQNAISVGAGVGVARWNLFKAARIVSAVTTAKSRTFHFSNRVGVAQFIMRENDLIVDPFFAEKVHKLPETLNTKSYFQLFEQFGTGFMHSGTLGGQFEDFYVYTDEDMNRQQMDERALQNCVGVKVGADWGFSLSPGTQLTPGFNTTVENNNCLTTDSRLADKDLVTRGATKKFKQIVGGTAEGLGRVMGSALVMSEDEVERIKYEDWIASLRENPAVIDYSMRSICDLFEYTGLERSAGLNKKTACEQAVRAYLEPYSDEKCAPCKNDGQRVNINQQCLCACAAGFAGDDCSEDLNPSNANQGLFRDLVMQKKANLKLITNENGVARDPPQLLKKMVGPLSSVLKSQGERLMLLATETNSYQFNNGKGVGGYSIKFFDTQLREETDPASVSIDFSSLDECQVEGTTCQIRDFDVDGSGKIVISVKVLRLTGSSTVIYRLNNQGEHELTLASPCQASDRSTEDQSLVTTSCDDRIIVSCPDPRRATVKVFAADGAPIGLTQFRGFAPLTSLQFFDGTLYFHTRQGQIGAFALDTWERQLPQPDQEVPVGSATLGYTQLFVDFLGNVIVGQRENGVGTGSFSVLDPQSGGLLTRVELTGWTDCAYVSAFVGRLFALCHQTHDASQRAILAFDYLK